jgi:hypothetical protein
VTITRLSLGVYLITFLVGGNGGCISSAPIVPVTPANSAQVSACQNIASVHNGIVVGDFVIGGSAIVIPTVAAALPSTNTTAKTDLAVTSAIVGGVTAIGAGLGAFYATDFANQNCSSVVGVLPPAPSAPQEKKIQ